MIASTFLLVGSLIQSSTENFVEANFLIILDAFINAICFMLQFSFNRNYYSKLCKFCHKRCKNYISESNQVN